MTTDSELNAMQREEQVFCESLRSIPDSILARRTQMMGWFVSRLVRLTRYEYYHRFTDVKAWADSDQDEIEDILVELHSRLNTDSQLEPATHSIQRGIVAYRQALTYTHMMEVMTQRGTPIVTALLVIWGLNYAAATESEEDKIARAKILVEKSRESKRTYNQRIKAQSLATTPEKLPQTKAAQKLRVRLDRITAKLAVLTQERNEIEEQLLELESSLATESDVNQAHS